MHDPDILKSQQFLSTGMLACAAILSSTDLLSGCRSTFGWYICDILLKQNWLVMHACMSESVVLNVAGSAWACIEPVAVSELNVDNWNDNWEAKSEAKVPGLYAVCR